MVVAGCAFARPWARFLHSWPPFAAVSHVCYNSRTIGIKMALLRVCQQGALVPPVDHNSVPGVLLILAVLLILRSSGMALSAPECLPYMP
jgi:hypothetical protein